MPDPQASTPPAVAKELPRPEAAGLDSLNVKGDGGYSERLVDAIEMMGEEEAAGFKPRGADGITPGMRYLHCSRTIHQLVTDRNRAVGIFLAVAGLLMTGSGAIFHANPQGDMMIPLEEIKRWCLPLTFGTLTVLALLVALLLIRTRAGLIYEVAKMNALLGLPSRRVERINPLSIFFIMQTIISLAGGLCAGLFTAFMIHRADPNPTQVMLPAIGVGAGVSVGLLLLYMLTVKYITSDKKLQRLDEKK